MLGLLAGVALVVVVAYLAGFRVEVIIDRHTDGESERVFGPEISGSKIVGFDVRLPWFRSRSRPEREDQ